MFGIPLSLVLISVGLCIVVLIVNVFTGKVTDLGAAHDTGCGIGCFAIIAIAIFLYKTLTGG